jgi:hypothetical protein
MSLHMLIWTLMSQLPSYYEGGKLPRVYILNFCISVGMDGRAELPTVMF